MKVTCSIPGCKAEAIQSGNRPVRCADHLHVESGVVDLDSVLEVMQAYWDDPGFSRYPITMDQTKRMVSALKVAWHLVDRASRKDATALLYNLGYMMRDFYFDDDER